MDPRTITGARSHVPSRRNCGAYVGAAAYREEGAMNSKDIRTNEPACAARDDDLRRIAVMMVEHDCGEIPICDDARKPIGVVTDRDITCRLVAKGKNPLE